MSGKYSSFVAVGDSFTEGVGDPSPNGPRPRGWADLFAGAAARENPEFAYANLAIRGRLFDIVVDEQIPPTIRQNPDLVSFSAGANDALRPSFHPERMATRCHEVVRMLKASGAEVILFTMADLSCQIPGMSFMRKRFSVMNEMVRKVSNRHNAILIDLWKEDVFQDGTYWAEDRLHLSPKGHIHVATKVCEAVEIKPDPAWEQTIPTTSTSSDLSGTDWARKHLGPWLKRRLTGRSSGDTVQPKRPELKPMAQ